MAEPGLQPMRSSLLIAALLSSMPAIALACSCAPPLGELQRQVKDALGKADGVALARVISRKKLDAAGERESSDYAQLVTQFQLIKGWKGIQTEKFPVLTYSEPSMCGKTFSEGVEYLLYLYGPNEQGYYHTNSCSGTGYAKKAQQEMKLLDEATSN